MMLGSSHLGMMGGGGSLSGSAIHFNGSTYIHRNAALTGAVRGYQGTLSFWHKIAAANISDDMYFADGGSVEPYRSSTSGFGIGILTYDQSTSFSVASTINFISADAWHHLLVSWDTNHASGSKVYSFIYDGSSYGSVTVYDDYPAFIDGYDFHDFSVGAGVGGWTKATCDIAEFYLNTVTAITDVTKFRNASTGKPVNLGNDGSLPTGAPPMIYLSATATANDFLTNHGVGGNFIVAAGALSVASTSPF